MHTYDTKGTRARRSITRNKYLLSRGMGKEREEEKKKKKKERGIIRPGAISPGAVNYLK